MLRWFAPRVIYDMQAFRTSHAVTLVPAGAACGVGERDKLEETSVQLLTPYFFLLLWGQNQKTGYIVAFLLGEIYLHSVFSLSGKKLTLRVMFLLLCQEAVPCVWTGCCTCLEDTIQEAIQISSTCWIQGLRTEYYTGKELTAKEFLHHQRTNSVSGYIKTSE